MTSQHANSTDNAPAPRPTPWYFTGKGVLCILLFNIVLTPFIEQSSTGMLFESVLFTLLLGLGVLAVGGTRHTLLTAVVLSLPAVASRWLIHVSPGIVPAELFLVFAVAAIGYVVWQFLKFIAVTRRVDSGVLCTGIAAFLLIALLWAFLYQLIDRQIPGSFACSIGTEPAREMRGLIAFYFSLVTLCTVGFGDIVPASDIARVCAMLEGATGVFFIALLVSRLVSFYCLQQQAPSSGGDPPVQSTPR